MNLLLGILALKGQVVKDKKAATHCRDESPQILIEVAEYARRTFYSHLCSLGPAWLFPQDMMQRFDLGFQRDKESALSRLHPPVRMHVVVLPATTAGIVEQIAFKLKIPENCRPGSWSFRDKHGRVSRQTDRGFEMRKCLHPLDHRRICLDYCDQVLHLPQIPIPPYICTHKNDLVAREPVPRRVFGKNWRLNNDILIFPVDVWNDNMYKKGQNNSATPLYQPATPSDSQRAFERSLPTAWRSPCLPAGSPNSL